MQKKLAGRKIRSVPIPCRVRPGSRSSGFFVLYNIIVFVMVAAAASQAAKHETSEENRMPSTLDAKKVSKTIKIFAVVQFGLMALLVYTAVMFQQRLQMIGKGNTFMSGVIAASVIQLLLFYPIYRFAGKEADRDLTLTASNLTKEELKAISKKKRFSDIIKMSTFGFYLVFILAAPRVPLVMSIIFYSFILTILTYLQCYNFAAKRLMKGSNPK
jgi:hypothetical protein